MPIRRAQAHRLAPSGRARSGRPGRDL